MSDTKGIPVAVEVEIAERVDSSRIPGVSRVVFVATEAAFGLRSMSTLVRSDSFAREEGLS
jgi:hypothetical protein